MGLHCQLTACFFLGFGFMLQYHHRLGISISVHLQEPLLKALQYLPDIIKLQRVLTTHFNLKIDRNECQTKVFIRDALAQVSVSSGKMRCISAYKCMHALASALAFLPIC